MKLFLDDSACREAFFPFTRTRCVADIRLGILTLREKWERLTGFDVETDAARKPADAIIISANIIPTKSGLPAILESLRSNTALVPTADLKILQHPWEIFQLNDWAIRQDFALITAGRKSAPIPPTTKTMGLQNIFLEEGAVVDFASLNSSTGPIYIGKNVQVMEGSFIRGPFSAGEGSVIKMGSRIYGATTLGPYCVAGGEIKNSVMFGYSNKAHDGYLGDSLIGEWCNLGAGTSNSNVKNTGGEVRYLAADDRPSISAGRKAGLLMGDYSRSAINTSFNTGTIVGVCCNIFGEMPPKNVPDFSWGKDKYILEKALIDIANWKSMKGAVLSPKERTMIEGLYSITDK